MPSSSAVPASGQPQRTLYGRRLGRPLKAARQSALDAWLPRLTVALPQDRPLDPAALFAAAAPPVREIWLEVGFGAGEHLLAQSRAHPDVGLIGCEPFVNGMGSLMMAIAREPERAANMRVFMDDARRLIATLPDASLARVFVLFPDPWPKARHHKRRFVAPTTLDTLARVMRDGAELRVASDHEDYIAWSLTWLNADRRFAPLRAAAEHRERPADWPATRYEAKARAEGRRPAFLAYRRQARA